MEVGKISMKILIFILLSIKTRIETTWNLNPLTSYKRIFILLSIKTRIETLLYGERIKYQ